MIPNFQVQGPETAADTLKIFGQPQMLVAEITIPEIKKKVTPA